MENFEKAILKIICNLGTDVSTSQIYKALEEGKIFKLQEHHFKESYGRPSYQHEVRSYLSNMFQDGLVERLSRGIYRITEKGNRKL